MAHADYDGESGTIKLQTVWNEKQLAKAIPGSRWDAHEKLWRVTASWASLIIMRGLFSSSLEVSDALRDWSWKLYRERVEPTLAVRNALQPTDDESREMKVLQSWRD